MTRRDPDKPGLAALDAHKEAFESGRTTASEIADTLGVSRQVANRAIKRRAWARPSTDSDAMAPVAAPVHRFSTEEASALLVSLAIGVLVNCHDLVSGGGLSPSSLKAIAAAAVSAEATLERRGVVAVANSGSQIQPLEVRVLSPSEEDAIRAEIEAAARDLNAEFPTT